MAKEETKSMKAKKRTTNLIVHILLAVLAFIWLVPVAWVVMQSFSGSLAPTSSIIPKTWSLNNYKKLFTDTQIFNFPRMFLNTLFISCVTCVISTFFVLSVSYCMSRLRFRVRKPFMNVAMILGLFPGFMSMVAVYYILKAIGLTEGARIRLALILVYSASSGLGFYIAKGFFDTIPKALDEAAYLDGCTRWQVFTKVTMPLSKPIVVYTILTSFLGPWLDFIFAKVICRANADYYTVSIGLWSMLEKEYINSWYSCFAAGAVIISIPISIMFIKMQKFYTNGLAGAVKG